MKSRRNFIKTTAAATLGSLFSTWAIGKPNSDKYGNTLPLRTITRDGEKSTAFALGGVPHVDKPKRGRIRKTR